MKYKNSLVAMVPFLGLIMNSCESEQNEYQLNGEPVYLKSTLEFSEQSKKFPIKPDQAIEIALVHSRQQRPEQRMHAIGEVVAIVSNDYVISLPEKNYISFSGLYVNGFTGEVEERTESYKIRRL